MKGSLEKHTRIFLFLAGGIVVMAALLPGLILGEDMVVRYEDQLDGEVLAYMLHAKYLFTGTGSYPELMNGIPKNGMFPPAPLLVLLYRVMPPVSAYVFSSIFCMMTAYAGMYLCLGKMTGNACIAAFCGIVFACLPLFPVYGLCQYGQPALLYACFLLYEGRCRVRAMAAVVMYGLLSSLVLVGYAALGVGALYLLWLLWKRRAWEHRWLCAGWAALLGCYLACNRGLLCQIFRIGEQRASHKEIIVRQGQDVWEAFWTVFYRGTLHTPTHHQAVVWLCTGILLTGTVFWRRLPGRTRTAFFLLAGGFGFNLACALFYASYQSGFMAGIRNQAGGVIKEFQLDRVYWLSVSVWYMLLGLGLHLVWEWAGICRRRRALARVSAGAACLLAACASAASVFYYSDLNKNIHRLRFGEDYRRVTWKDFYAPELFSQIDRFIGRDKSSYRTLSFGIYPAAPLYNGFYCLDGYSNNYDLSYLYQFRDIIKGELEKDAALRRYYDEWGCRCYVLSAELGINNYLIAKDSGISVTELAIDAEAARRLGAEYLFSAVEIPNAQELGISLLRGEPFETPDSHYAIYLYGF